MLVFLWLRINFWRQFHAEFCPNRARAWTNSPVFSHFLIVSGKQSWSDLRHICFLWPKTLGTPDMTQSLKCSHPPPPPLPRSTSFPGLYPYGAAILVSNEPNLIKGGRGNGLTSPIAEYPGTTTSIHLKSRWQVGYPGCVFSLLRRDSSIGVGGHSFGQTKSLRRMTVTGNCAWKVFGTQGTVFCAITEK